MATKDIVVANDGMTNFLALKMDVSMVREIMATALDGEALTPRDLGRVRMPPGGGTMWVLNTADGETAEKTIRCVIVAQRQVRVYWKDSLETSGGNKPPDCFSDDAVHGIGDPGMACDVCPNAMFGTGKGKSQACSLKRMIFFLLPDQLLPSYISLPPTSQAEGKSYITKLMSLGLMPWDVVTEITLDKATNAAGITYSKATFKRATNLSEDEKARMRAVVAEIRPAITSTRLVAADIDGSMDRDDSVGRAMPSDMYANDDSPAEEF